MKTRIWRTAVFALILCALLYSASLSCTVATASQDGVIIKSCNQSYRTTDLPNLPQDCSWRINYLRYGSVVGAEVGETLEEVIENKNDTLERCGSWDSKYNDTLCEMIGKPSEPICTRCPKGFQPRDEESVNMVSKTYEEWEDQIVDMTEELASDSVASRLRGENISLWGAGSVLRSYRDALKAANVELRRLTSMMLDAQETGTNVMMMVDAATRVERAGNRADAEFRALPLHVRQAIKGTGRSSTSRQPIAPIPPRAPQPPARPGSQPRTVPNPSRGGTNAPSSESSTKPCGDVPYRISACIDDCRYDDEACNARRRRCREEENRRWAEEDRRCGRRP